MLVGGLVPIQSGINSSLSKYLAHPLQATVFNFVGGTLILLVLSVVLRFPFLIDTPWSKIPKLYFTGGAFGVVFVTTAVLLMPKIGAATLLAAIVTGQLIFAVLMDHYGWLNVPQHSFSLLRLMGIGMLLSGVYFIQRF